LNPGKLADSSSAYTMAFSTIMLNTDAHSNQVANKMTFQQFINNNRGMNNGKDFEVSFLKGIYDDIKQNELKLKPREGEASYTLATNRLANDALFNKLDKELGKRNPDLKKGIDIEGAQTSISNKKPWYSFLTGYKSTVTVTKDGNEVTLEISKPGLFSKNKEPSVVIKPKPGENGMVSPDSINLAAQVVSKFEAPAVGKSPYPYQQKEMERAVDSVHLKEAPMKQAFEKYAKNSGHSAELSFINEVDALRKGIEQGADIGELHVQAFGIQQRYLVPGADSRVHVDPKIEGQIGDKLDDLVSLEKEDLKKLFNAAEVEVKEKLSSGPMQKFKQTDEFEQQKKTVMEATNLTKKTNSHENVQKKSVKQSL
jgi:hypothetical protein